MHSGFDVEFITLAGHSDANAGKKLIDNMDYVEKLCNEKLIKFNQSSVSK